MSTVRLESSDGEIIETETRVAKCSVTIKQMLEDLGIEEGIGDQTVPLPNVNAATLRKFLEWANHHKDDVAVVPIVDARGQVEADCISDWDKEFFDVDQGTLVALIMAANYLDVKPLFDLACRTAAKMLTGKTAAQMRTTLRINRDLTVDEKRLMREEAAWCKKKK